MNYEVKISTGLAIILASIQASVFAAPYPNISAMLQAIAPTAAVDAPELNTLIIALNAIPTPEQRTDALLTLVPYTNDSLRVASEGPMRQFYSVLNDRLIRVMCPTGVSAGDVDPEDPDVNKSIEKLKEEIKKLDQKLKEIKTSGQKPIVEVKKDDPKPIVEVKKDDPKPKEEVKNQDPKPKEEVKKDDPKSKEEVKGHDPEVKSDDLKIKEEVSTKEELSTKEEADVKVVSVEEEQAKIEKVEIRDPIHGAWIQVLGDIVDQGERHSIPGFDADVWGIVIGRDYLVCPNLAIGGAIGYQNARIDTEFAPSGSYYRNKRFQGTLYAGFHCRNFYYINAAITYAHNEYDSYRYILVPPFGGDPIQFIAEADFDGEEIDGYVELGFHFYCGHLRTTPKVMLSYSWFNFDHYFENDAYGLDLNVKYHDMNFLPLGAGIKIEYKNDFPNVFVIPEIHAYYFHDFIADPQDAAALFTAGGFEFLTEGAKSSKNSLEVGAGIAVHSYLNTMVSIQYDYASRKNYHRHAGFIKVRHEWA